MTPQEAIKWLNEAEILDLTSGNTKDRQALNMAVAAFEKQIPKKPEYKEEDRFVKNHFAWYGYCPQCGCEINMGDLHCTQCGQAIDWSEDNG